MQSRENIRLAGIIDLTLMYHFMHCTGESIVPSICCVSQTRHGPFQGQFQWSRAWDQGPHHAPAWGHSTVLARNQCTTSDCFVGGNSSPASSVGSAPSTAGTPRQVDNQAIIAAEERALLPDFDQLWPAHGDWSEYKEQWTELMDFGFEQVN